MTFEPLADSPEFMYVCGNCFLYEDGCNREERHEFDFPCENVKFKTSVKVIQ
jgi:hypothetical protein